MKNTLRIMCILTFLQIIFICGCAKDNKREGPPVDNKNKTKINTNSESDKNRPTLETVVNDNPDCVEFVALWAAGDIAERIGRDRKWVFLNYTVDLWDSPPTYGSDNIVGKLRASSYARIIATMGNDYKVESPINQVQGWISNEHVKAISKKNPKTRALCE